MKKRLSTVIAVVLIAAAALSLTACGSKEEAPAETSSSVAAETSEASVKSEAPAAGEVLTVAYGDFEAQQTLSKSIQNMECTDKTVEIDGTSRKLGSSYSIGQSKDGQYVGTTYEFDGEYPADGAHVKVTGTVVTEGLSSRIVATSVEVME